MNIYEKLYSNTDNTVGPFSYFKDWINGLPENASDDLPITSSGSFFTGFFDYDYLVEEAFNENEENEDLIDSLLEKEERQRILAIRKVLIFQKQ